MIRIAIGGLQTYVTRRELLSQLAVAGSLACLPFGATRSDPQPSAERPIFFDKSGLIVHRSADGKDDGGDTAQREGWYWLGVWIRKEVLHQPWPVQRQLTVDQAMTLLEPSRNGIFYRNPTLKPWNNPFDRSNGFSRDQMTPVVAAMGMHEMTDRIRRLWNALPQDPTGGTKHTFNGEWVSVLGARLFYTGDIVGPMTINLFRRAWAEDPLLARDHNGLTGEPELQGTVLLRLEAARRSRDDTGDDLNLIVMLLMSSLRYPSTPHTANAIRLYKSREPSYGSYLTRYRQEYGLDLQASPAEMQRRLDKGIANGWKPDVSPAVGAVRWYHRAETGANPLLATLYEPIIRHFIDNFV